jgi:hypothetical protein
MPTISVARLRNRLSRTYCVGSNRFRFGQGIPAFFPYSFHIPCTDRFRCMVTWKWVLMTIISCYVFRGSQLAELLPRFIQLGRSQKWTNVTSDSYVNACCQTVRRGSISLFQLKKRTDKKDRPGDQEYLKPCHTIRHECQNPFHSLIS